MMKYDTIEDGEATPLQISEGASVAPSSTNNKRTSSIIVRALMVGTTLCALLLMAGHSKMTMNKTSNVDGMVVVSEGSSSQETTDPNGCISFYIGPGTGCDYMCQHCATILGTGNYYFTDPVCTYESGGCVGNPIANAQYTCCAGAADQIIWGPPWSTP